jgi:predicted Zn-ribbon and HTH transcriptional regulator
MKCLKCNYDWRPRVEKPKECPECKTRLSKLNGERK